MLLLSKANAIFCLIQDESLLCFQNRKNTHEAKKKAKFGAL